MHPPNDALPVITRNASTHPPRPTYGRNNEGAEGELQRVPRYRNSTLITRNASTHPPRPTKGRNNEGAEGELQHVSRYRNSTLIAWNASDHPPRPDRREGKSEGAEGEQQRAPRYRNSTGTVLLFCALTAALSASAQHPHWRTTIGPVERNGHHLILLSPEVVARSQASLNDIRLLAPDSTLVPYLTRTEPNRKSVV